MRTSEAFKLIAPYLTENDIMKDEKYVTYDVKKNFLLCSQQNPRVEVKSVRVSNDSLILVENPKTFFAPHFKLDDEFDLDITVHEISKPVLEIVVDRPEPEPKLEAEPVISPVIKKKKTKSKPGQSI